MTNDALRAFVPRHKHDLNRARKVISLGYPGVAPIIPELLEWLQDMNWPVAQVLQPFLASIGPPIVENVRTILRTDDMMWKYWILGVIVRENSGLARALEPDLLALLETLGSSEDDEEIKSVIREILTGVSSS